MFAALVLQIHLLSLPLRLVVAFGGVLLVYLMTMQRRTLTEEEEIDHDLDDSPRQRPRLPTWMNVEIVNIFCTHIIEFCGGLIMGPSWFFATRVQRHLALGQIRSAIRLIVVAPFFVFGHNLILAFLPDAPCPEASGFFGSFVNIVLLVIGY